MIVSSSRRQAAQSYFANFLPGLLLVVGTLISGLAQAQFISPDRLQTTLQGCRQMTANTIVFPAPSTNGSPVGFVCEEGFGTGATSDGSYTTGNVFNWNELDLVPFRVTLSLNPQSTTPTYNIVIAADHSDGGVFGYDVITAPAVNQSLESPGDCSIDDAGVQSIGPNIAGGADDSIFRELTITQTPGSTCVIDYTQRLAVGASQYPGASLHGYKFVGDDFQEGKADVPIFVNNILPQELDKDMTASQDTDFVWNVIKGPMPANVSFGDTCNIDPGDFHKDVEITVEWEILPGIPGMVTVVTNISATNPASRAITVEVVDEIWGDIGNGKEFLDAKIFAPVVIAANTTAPVGTHMFEAPANVTDLMDWATASYIDTLTGVPINQVTEAHAESPIQPGNDTNTTAVITDVESISGNGLSYAVNGTALGSATGAFQGGYIPGTETTGDVTWVSGTQAGDGFVTFLKSIWLDEPRITTGALSDVATLNASDQFVAGPVVASIGITSGATVKLTIEKTIPDILQGDETVTFTFDVQGPDNFATQVDIVFNAGDTFGMVMIPGLAPGQYVVTEQPEPPFVPNGGSVRIVDIDLPNCTGTAAYENVLGGPGARAEVKKITFPAGNEAGWQMTLTGPGGPEVLVTSDASFHPFALALQEGAYTITETTQDGWDKTMESTECSFTVNFPADANRVYQCVITNVQRGEIHIEKRTEPVGGTGFGYTHNIDGSGPFTLDDTDTEWFTDLVPGTYVVTEDDPTPAFDLVAMLGDGTQFECTDSDGSGTPSTVDLVQRKATIELDPGETVNCTFTNRQRGMVDVIKLTEGVENPNLMWKFTLQGPGVNVMDLTPPTLVDFNMSKLIPGEIYTLCETMIPSGWTLEWWLDKNGNGQIDGEPPDELLPFIGDRNLAGLNEIWDPEWMVFEASNDNRCIDFTVEAGETVHYIIDNQFPGGEPRTIGYWKNWNTCSGGDQALTAAANGGSAAGFFILDDVLPQSVGGLIIDNCTDGRLILDKRQLDGKHRKVASDAAYGLAAQLLAAKANFTVGAETCPAATDAAQAADALLMSIGFDGTGTYLKGKDPLRQTANNLAGTLDDYNNGTLCP